MTILIHELKRNRISFLIWTISIAFMLFICMIMYPEMKTSMNSVTDMFANMGGFTEAFGMDQVNFGEVMGFYAIECGNILGIGGGFFAALLGIGILSKEEKERTAEFLLTHPIRRSSVIFQKLLAVLLQLLIMNLVLTAASAASFALIGETLAMKEFLLLHTAYLVLQLEIACICFGISAFIRQSGLGVGLGLAAILYFANIIGNINSSGEFIKYITPFAYAEASDIISSASIEMPLMLLGCLYGIAGIVAAFIKYMRKDIAA
ncbi:MAG: ABC transporter permease [Clostridia bacterium]|jgi:ABC-2 type transport system permease protein|nr:ABC transporter permease subunit [Lachnospiraceae bacterium]NCC00208.1 ABC transporter permease [Clostridia bacterium]NCD03310.1 ABC transporter permease [Clostridia bacterium]